MTLKIITPDGILFNDEITGVTARTLTGDIRILKGHTDYVTPISGGKIKITQQNIEKSGTSQRGLISVSGGDITIISWKFIWE